MIDRDKGSRKKIDDIHLGAMWGGRDDARCARGIGDGCVDADEFGLLPDDLGFGS